MNFEKYFGSNKLDLIEKPLEKVNKTSLDIVFIEDKKNFIVIEVAYYEHGHEKSKKTFNSDIKSESFFQFDSFYIKNEKGYDFKLFLNQKSLTELETNIRDIKQVYNFYKSGVRVTKYSD